ncbi:MAG: hypothetical protein QXW18_06425, partial [Candidatus Bathyarchaeia archaeon]
KLTCIRVGEAIMWKEVEKLLEKPKSKAYLHLITYALLEEKPVEGGFVEEGVYMWPNLISSVRKLISQLSRGKVKVQHVWASIRLLGAGFDLARGVRKPSYLALTPGSIIEIEIDGSSKDSLLELYYKGLSARANSLGYGTFLPIPTPAGEV